MPSFSLLTNVLKHEHIKVLGRWLDFMAVTPERLILSVPDDPAIARDLEALARARGTVVDFDRIEDAGAIRDAERDLLHRQFAMSASDYCITIRLDTIVFRTGGNGWLADVLDRLDENPHYVFATGMTRPYRADRPFDDPRFHETQRVSNNFMVVRRDWWFETQELYLDRAESRFYVEGCIEWRCRDEDLWGLRCLNRPDWRMLHVQVWDDRLESIQRNFEAGTGLEPYLRGFEDDAIYEWERYYMMPAPSWTKRMRIHAGRWRRDLLERLSAAFGK